jgi:hypothetical protein
MNRKKKIKRVWDSLISFYISVEIESVTYVAFLFKQRFTFL